MKSQFLLVVGVMLLIHAAYSCLHYRELVRDLAESGFEQETSGRADASSVPKIRNMPLDVLVEVILGSIIIFLSELVRAGSTLQPVTSKGGFRTRPIVAPAYRTREFDVYTSRARGLY